MKVSFDQNRCYFGSFTAEDDKDPNTGKSGVRYINFRLNYGARFLGF
ncbi:hypothetical protein [Parachlamydia acanthamoebae]|nr:hypothetical protein [Parachlamydia acanthamoebae]